MKKYKKLDFNTENLESLSNSDKTSIFINKVKKIHGDKFDYSKTAYKKSTEKVTIICKQHGEFNQSPNNHLSGNGCTKCVLENRKIISNEDYIKSCKNYHGDRYDYSTIKYTGCKHNVTPSCKIHGVFTISADNFKKGHGCQKCGGNKVYNNIDFIKKSKEIHKNFYTYEKTEIKNSKEAVVITCPTHGDFKQQPYSHLLGKKCKKCSWELRLKINYEANGWGCSLWEEKAKSSKNFDSFKLYLIECKNDNESFYKIGRTFKKIKERFKYLPYDYTLIAELVSNDSCGIVSKENTIKKELKNQRYKPNLKFDGYSECFKIIDLPYIINKYNLEEI